MFYVGRPGKLRLRSPIDRGNRAFQEVAYAAGYFGHQAVREIHFLFVGNAPLLGGVGGEGGLLPP